MMSNRISRNTSVLNPKVRLSRNVRKPCFTLKRPLVFQVRKSLVEYVDEELLKMDTSVFYQRIYILTKNVEPQRESVQLAPAENNRSTETAASGLDGETATLRTADPMFADDEEQHYSQKTTPEGSQILTGAADEADGTVVKIADPFDPNKETLTRTFRFDDEDDLVVEAEEEEPEPGPEAPEAPKDIFAQFTEKLKELQKKCRNLSYSPDPMCGLVIYMNEYTLMMLESGEDMMGIFCGELLKITDDFWQSNRVFLMEDHIKELYTKELLFRRIPAAFLNEKFPPSTPTDEYLMGKQHLIIKEKLYNICSLISESLAPRPESRFGSRFGSTFQTDAFPPTENSEADPGESDDEEQSQRVQRTLSHGQRLTVAVSETLPPEIFRKLLPEIQRIELVLSSTRFYHTLQEFFNLYGQVPFGRDDDGLFWPIQNNYAPPNIFRRTQFDINLTFPDYAADMKRRLQEEQDKNRAELEASAAAAEAADQAQPSGRNRESQHPRKEAEANN